jgi:hypothetical protein
VRLAKENKRLAKTLKENLRNVISVVGFDTLQYIPRDLQGTAHIFRYTLK